MPGTGLGFTKFQIFTSFQNFGKIIDMVYITQIVANCEARHLSPFAYSGDKIKTFLDQPLCQGHSTCIGSYVRTRL